MVTPRLEAGSHELEVKVERPGVQVILATVLWWDRSDLKNYANE